MGAQMCTEDIGPSEEDHRAATKVQATVRGHIHRGKHHNFKTQAQRLKEAEAKTKAQAANKDQDEHGVQFEPENEDQTGA